MAANSDEWDALLEEHAPEPSSSSAASAQTGPVQKGRGRPANQGGNLLNRHLATHFPDIRPTGIEHARAVRARKVQERAAGSAALAGTPLAGSSSDDLQWMRKLGDPTVVVSAGDKVQNSLLLAARAAEAAQVCVEDALIERQLSSSLANVSCKALEEQLEERNIGRRILAIAAAFLELGSILWTLFLRFLLGASRTTSDSGRFAFRPVLMIYRLRYDETPTKLRVADPRVTDVSSASAAEAASANVLCSVVFFLTLASRGFLLY